MTLMFLIFFFFKFYYGQKITVNQLMKVYFSIEWLTEQNWFISTIFSCLSTNSRAEYCNNHVMWPIYSRYRETYAIFSISNNFGLGAIKQYRYIYLVYIFIIDAHFKQHVGCRPIPTTTTATATTAIARCLCFCFYCYWAIETVNREATNDCLCLLSLRLTQTVSNSHFIQRKYVQTEHEHWRTPSWPYDTEHSSSSSSSSSPSSAY